MDIKTLFRCSECGEEHDAFRYAEECCPPEIIELYQCPICKEKHREYEDAKICIDKCKAEKEAAGIMLMADKQELEKNGQERLF